MVDCYQNTQERRCPVLDLNLALSKEGDDEEEERHPKELLGPAWLRSRPQNTWLHLNEPSRSDEPQPQQQAVDGKFITGSLECHHLDKPVAQIPFFLGKEQHSLQASENNSALLKLGKDQFLPENHCPPRSGTETDYHIIDIWKTASNNASPTTQDFLVLHDKQNQDQSGSFGTLWESNEVDLPHVMEPLSPVSLPIQIKPLSPVSPELRPFTEASDDRTVSSQKQASPCTTTTRMHHGGGDPPSRRRREQDNSLSPRGFNKRRREHSPCVSPIGRSRRVGRSRSRTPRSRGHHYSPRSRHYSPRRRYSPRRWSSLVSYRPKRRPWSPPPNRNTGLGKPGRNLFIAGFSFGTTERDLERKFSRYGRVRDVRIVRDRRSGDSRGFGFLSLDRDENADSAIRGLDQTEWNGRIVLVEKAKEP